MRLAIETALTACSVALLDGARIVAERHEVVGRGHAERLVPMIAELLAGAGATRCDAVVVDIGPGSFTGLRVGIAAARAFGLAWGAPVAGATSTSLAAAEAYAADPALGAVAVALEAGRGNLYVQRFAAGVPDGDIAALTPEAAAAAIGDLPVAGSGAGLIGRADLIAATGLRAAAARLLPETALRPPSPVYLSAPESAAA